MQLLFDPVVPTLAIRNEERRFPVNRIHCVGRNYAAHAREMGSNEREAPFFFSKPANAVNRKDDVIPYPPRTADLHHEVELVIALKEGGRAVVPEEAEALIYGYGVGIDFTRRDLQAEAKKKGRPWSTAKGFDSSAPVSPLVPSSECGLLRSGDISLKVNGELRQQGDLSDMIWASSEIIAELSTYFELRPGDLIFTGTPAGVSAVEPGDKVEASIEGLGKLALQVKLQN